MIKLLEKVIGRTPSAINHSNFFFDPSPRVMEIKTKINKQKLIYTHKFSHKANHEQMKRQPRDWEKIFANNMTGKGLDSKTFKHFM